MKKSTEDQTFAAMAPERVQCFSKGPLEARYPPKCPKNIDHEIVVADAVATLNPMKPPSDTGTSLRDDLVALIEQAANCDDRPEIVTATFAMARSHPDLYRTLSDRFGMFVRTELNGLAKRAADEGHQPLSEVALEVLSDTVIALLAHSAGPTGTSIPQGRLITLVDEVLMVLIVGRRTPK